MKFLKVLFSKLDRRKNEYDERYNFTCDVCGREVFDNERICAACKKTLPWNDGFVCPFCGRKVLEAGTCIECKDEPLKVQKARSCFTHEGEALRLVLRFKKQGQKYLFRTLCDCLEPLLQKEFPPYAALSFIPMTEKAEKARGYNQSRLLAEELARRTGREFLDVAKKTKETPQQKTLGKRERAKNLEGCFRVFDRKRVRDREIVLIDDTMTTGATASTLADALKRAGARNVFLLTVTSVQKKNPFGIAEEEKQLP